MAIGAVTAGDNQSASQSELANELDLQSMFDGMVSEHSHPEAPRVAKSGEPSATTHLHQTQSDDDYSPEKSSNPEAQALRDEASDLRAEADELEAGFDGSDPNASRADLDMAQTLRNRATALEQRADTIDERDAISADRDRIREEGEALNRGEGRRPEMDGPTPRAPDDPVVEGWEGSEEVADIQELLTAVPGYEAADVTDARFMSDQELDLMLDMAESLGASAEDLELIEGYEQAFPVQFVFVDNLIEDFGAEAAAGGEIMIGNTTTILLDTQFKDLDFTHLSEGETPESAEAALEAAEFGLATVLEVFELPGSVATGDDLVDDEDNENIVAGLDDASADDE